MTDEELTAAAERFCAAPLPETVCADLVAIKPMKGRTGTNLLTVAEAKIMLAAAHATPPAPNDDLQAENERLREALRAIMDLPGEINPANYNHDDVHILNNSHIEAFHIAAAALKENRRG